MTFPQIRRTADIVLRPTSGWRAVNVGEVWRSRDLLWTLAIRDIKVRYRQTLLGATWVVLQPLIAAGLFAFVFGSVADLPSEGAPYFVFAYAGLLGWNLFSTTLAKVSASLVTNAGLVSKVFFPRLVLPLSTVGGSILDFFVAMGAMVVIMFANDTFPGLEILALPIWVVMAIVLALGVGLVGAALMVSYRDVGHVLPVLTQLILYASPVAYSLDAVPDSAKNIFLLNPLVGVLEGFRWSLVEGSDLRLNSVVYAAVASIVLLVMGAFAFARMERRFADVV